MSTHHQNTRELPATRRLWAWIPLIACLLGLGLSAPAAKANFTLQYTGTPFTNSDQDCVHNPCLTGNLTVEFHVLAPPPDPATAFCLALANLGSASNCLAVDFALVQNGNNRLLLESDPNNLATFELFSNSPYWLVSLVAFSATDPPSTVLLMNSDHSGSDYLLYGDQRGSTHTPGTWEILDTTVQDTPEPATWAALATGLGLMGLLRRKRSASSRSSDHSAAPAGPSLIGGPRRLAPGELEK